jgi:NAD(P)H-hydrate epimerase
MILRPLSREEVRNVDRRALDEFAIPGLVLMENAGRGAAALLREHLDPGARVLILFGPGNNGGDGMVVARFLDFWGFRVRLAWFADPIQLRGDAATQWNIVERAKFDLRAWSPDLLAEADWIVDGLFGTGLTRPVEGLFKDAINAVNASGKPALALDIPSGLDADRGVALGSAIVAKLTATFVSTKLGFAVPGASAFLGAVHIIEIGVPRLLLEPFAIPNSPPA